MSEQLAMDFSGRTYDATRDRKRLNTQFTRVQDFMSHKQWTSLAQIAAYAGCSEPTASARFRDLKNKLGWVTEKKNVGGGVWMMRVVSFGVKQ